MKEAETSRSLKLTIKLKGKNIATNSLTNDDYLNNGDGECNASNSSTFPQGDLSTSKVDCYSTEDEENPPTENNHLQLVLYDPAANGLRETEHVPNPISYGSMSFPRPHPFSDRTPRILPSIGAFTVQCANCFKWRLIPTKEKYEEIREYIMERPFVCETAREWQPDRTCNDPPDIVQDDSRLWAIDKPSIAQPPPGWQRLLRIRGEGSTRFADVYYVAPSGKRLRSMVEIQRYLDEHPKCIEEGVRLSKFSFQIPRPLQENYVRKRPARDAFPNEVVNPGINGSLASEVKALTWVSPDVDTDLHLSGPSISSPDFDARRLNPDETPSSKKKKMTKPSNQRFNTDVVDVYHRNSFNSGESHQP